MSVKDIRSRLNLWNSTDRSNWIHRRWGFLGSLRFLSTEEVTVLWVFPFLLLSSHEVNYELVLTGAAWRDGSVVKNPGCAFKQLRITSYYKHSRSQWPATNSSLRGLDLPSYSLRRHICPHAQKPPICLIKIKKNNKLAQVTDNIEKSIENANSSPHFPHREQNLSLLRLLYNSWILICMFSQHWAVRHLSSYVILYSKQNLTIRR